MAYMRDQHNAPYGNDYTQRGFGSNSDLSVVQPQSNRPSGWESSDGPAGGTSWQRSYGKNDYNYENEGKEPQRDFQQTKGAGYEAGGFTEGYGSSWPRGDSRTGGQLQNSLRGGGGGQWLGEGRDSSGAQWQGQERHDSGIHWQGQGRGSMRGDVDSHWPGQGSEKSGAQRLGLGGDDGGFQRQDQGREIGGTRPGQVLDDSGPYRQGQGRDDNGIHWQGQGRSNSDSQWQDQIGDNSGIHWQGRSISDSRWQDQVGDKSGLHWEGQGKDNSSIHWEGQGGDKSGLHWEGQGKDNSSIHYQGQGLGNSGILWEGQGRGNSGIHWQGQGGDKSGIHWQGQGRGNSDSQWPGQGGDKSGLHLEGQGKDNSSIHWEGQGRGKSGIHWQGQGGDKSGIHWQGQGRGNSDSQWPGQGGDKSGLYLEGQGKDNSSIHWEGQGRGNSDSQWQGQGGDKSGLHLEGQGKDNSSIHWEGQGRGNSGIHRQDRGSDSQWQDPGRDNSDSQWQDQWGDKSGIRWQGQERDNSDGKGVNNIGAEWQDKGRGQTGIRRPGQDNTAGLGRGRGLGICVAPGTASVDRAGIADTSSDVARCESGSYVSGGVKTRGVSGQHGPFVRNERILGQHGSRMDSGGVGRDVEVEVASSPGGSGSRLWRGGSERGRGGGELGRGGGELERGGGVLGRGGGELGRGGGRGRGGSELGRGGGELGRGGGRVQGEGELGRGGGELERGGGELGRGGGELGRGGVELGRGGGKLERGGGRGRGGSERDRVGGELGRGGGELGRGGGELGRGGGRGRGGSELGRGGGELGRGGGRGRGGSELGRGGGELGRGGGELERGGGELGRGGGELGRGGGRCRGGSELGRGGGELGRGGGRGRGGSELGRGAGELGRGGGMGRGVSERGRGGGRGGSTLGRGGGLGRSELGRGGGGGQGGSGLGRGRGGGQGDSELGMGGDGGRPVQSSSPAAIDDTADEASEQGNVNGPPPESSRASLVMQLKKWQTFAKGFFDCGNAVSNVECSLTASKARLLKLIFDCKFLAKCGNNQIFTAVLKAYRLSHKNTVTEDYVFLARSQGLNKKIAKRSCYDEAYKVLLNSSVEEIMSRKEPSEATVKQEVQLHFKTRPEEFIALLKGDTVSNLEEDTKEPDKKRTSSGATTGPAPKRSKQAEIIMAMILNDNAFLAPTKRIDAVNPSDPLVDKLQMLKQLLKEEGITKLHIVPKIDQLSYKATIHIQNVYRFEDVPAVGLESSTPVYCEIYFDGVFITRGAPDVQKHIAAHHAYSNLAGLLFSKSMNALANNPRIWNPYMALEADVHNVVTKYHGKDNDCFMTSNVLNMKQMMQSIPDVKIPIEQMVLTEHESDKNNKNEFKALEMSATRNLMLLECETLRMPDLTFTCTISLQGKILTTQVDPTANGAKRLCSEVIMNNLKTTQNIIYVKTGFTGRTITKSELLSNATKKKALGVPPAKIFKKITDHKEDAAEEKEKQGGQDSLPETEIDKSLFPWIAAAVYEILDEYYQKITLEDLIVDLEDMPKQQRDIVSSCAAKMGLRVVTKSKTSCKNSYVGTHLRRTVTGQDMDKILQLHGGESGRYKLVSIKNPLSKEQLEKFRNQCLEQHKKLVDARTNDTPDEHPEPSSEVGSQSGKSGASDNKTSKDNKTQQAENTPEWHLSHRAPAIRPLMMLDARPRMNPFPYGRYPCNRF